MVLNTYVFLNTPETFMEANFFYVFSSQHQLTQNLNIIDVYAASVYQPLLHKYFGKLVRSTHWINKYKYSKKNMQRCRWLYFRDTVKLDVIAGDVCDGCVSIYQLLIGEWTWVSWAVGDRLYVFWTVSFIN